MNQSQIFKKIKSSLFVFVVFASVAAVAAQSNAPRAATAALRQKLQARLNEWHAAGKFPGATLAVCLADGNCFALATGYADLEAKSRMKPDSVMAAGSVGKTFAAAVALQLVGEGKIALDDRIEKYLGRETWFARLPNARQITVRQLMNHTSGLVRYEFKEQFVRDLTANPDKTWRPEELVAYLFDEKAPFEAGKGWDYSDTNYIVLGMIIEKATGRRFYDEARRRLLKPLKLDDTSPQDRRELKNLIPGYAGAGNPFGGRDKVIENGKFIFNPQFEWTGGGMISTTENLARWAKAMYEGKAFGAGELAQMLDGVPARLGRDAKYGLGVIIRPTPLGESYGHSGFFPGYMTDVMYFPEHKIAVAVQVNSSVPQSFGKPLGRVLLEAAAAVLDKEIPPPATSAAPAPPAKKQFVALRLNPKYQDEKAWTTADNEALGRRFAEPQQRQKEGKLILAGRATVRESMGVVVLEVESEDEARRMTESDDAVRAGLMSAEVLPFQTAPTEGN